MMPAVVAALRDGLGVEDMAATGVCSVGDARSVVAWLRCAGVLKVIYGGDDMKFDSWDQDALREAWAASLFTEEPDQSEVEADELDRKNAHQRWRQVRRIMSDGRERTIEELMDRLECSKGHTRRLMNGMGNQVRRDSVSVDKTELATWRLRNAD